MGRPYQQLGTAMSEEAFPWVVPLIIKGSMPRFCQLLHARSASDTQTSHLRRGTELAVVGVGAACVQQQVSSTI